jgi:hypothetical protein
LAKAQDDSPAAGDTTPAFPHETAEEIFTIRLASFLLNRRAETFSCRSRFVRVCGLLSVLYATALLAPPASAQIVQSLHLGGRAFLPTGESTRAPGDVLNENLNSLSFRISDFNSGQVFAEWLIGFGDHIEFGAGVGYYAGGERTVYRDYTDIDGSEIEQDLRLRIVPVTGVVRFFGGAPDISSRISAWDRGAELPLSRSPVSSSTSTTSARFAITTQRRARRPSRDPGGFPHADQRRRLRSQL